MRPFCVCKCAEVLHSIAVAHCQADGIKVPFIVTSAEYLLAVIIFKWPLGSNIQLIKDATPTPAPSPERSVAWR